MIIKYGVNHASFHTSPKTLKGSLPVPGGFETFKSALGKFPKDFNNIKAMVVSEISDSLSLELKDSVIGMKLRASGELHTELFGVNYIKRIITTKPNEHLKLSYRSKDSISYVDDLIYLSEGSSFSYDGRFKSKKGEFVNLVHVVHKEPNAKSEVSVKGLVFKEASILTTGELLSGSKDSKTSVNSFVVVFGDGKINAVPKLLISDPNTTSFHSFKKIYLTPEQAFFLESRGIRQNNIEQFYERFILGD